jgi:hypothetical protein
MSSATPTLTPIPTRTPTPFSPTPTPTSASCSIFPPDNPWNTDVSGYPLHPNSAAYINFIGSTKYLHPDFGTFWNGAPIGFPYAVVPAAQPLVPVAFLYADESDPGPYPIPDNAPIEGGPESDGDRHVLVIDTDHCLLYEVWRAFKADDGWKGGSGATFNANASGLIALAALREGIDPADTAEIAARVRARFPSAPPDIADHVSDFVRTLRQMGLVASPVGARP